MAKKHLIILLAAFTLAAFSSVNTEIPEKKYDFFLSNSICGVWSYGDKIIRFDADFKFEENVYLCDSDNRLNFLYSRKGVYSIENGTLYLKTTEWNFQNNSLNNNQAVTLNNYQLKIDGVKMIWNESIELSKKTEKQMSREEYLNSGNMSIKEKSAGGLTLSCVRKEFFFVLEKKDNVFPDDIDEGSFQEEKKSEV